MLSSLPMALCRLQVRRKLGLVFLGVFLLLAVQTQLQLRLWPPPQLSYTQAAFSDLDQRLRLYVLLLEREGLPLFIVDPILLLPLVPPSTRDWISRDPAMERLFRLWDNLDHSEPPSTLLVGIVANDTGTLGLEQLVQMISVTGQAEGFQVQVLRQDPPRHIQISAWNGTRQLPMHVFLSQHRYTLHILVFHSVQNSSAFWTSAVNQSVYQIAFQSRNPFDISLGNQETLFDEFGLRPATLELSSRGVLVPVLVPLNVLHFIQQIPNARFVQCNQSFAQEFRRNHSGENASSAENQRIADATSRFALITMKSLLRESFIPFWACFGTLLGWWRQCGAIPYTTDLDFCTFSQFSHEDEELVQELVDLATASQNVGYMWTYGKPNEGLEMVFETVEEPSTNASIRSDLFFMYPASKEFDGNETRSGDGWLVYIHWYTKRQYQFYHLPRVTDFCSTLLWDLKVQVPCDPLPTLLNDYGQEWLLPIDDGFSYLGNLSDLFTWNQSDHSRVFAQYPINYF